MPASNFTRFVKGEINRKGGMFSYTDAQRVYVVDEEKFEIVVDETRHYIRVKVDGEHYSNSQKGRLKLKENVKEVI